MDDKKQETLTEVDSQEDICENQKKKRKNNANTQATTIKFHRGIFTNLYLIHEEAQNPVLHFDFVFVYEKQSPKKDKISNK